MPRPFISNLAATFGLLAMVMPGPALAAGETPRDDRDWPVSGPEPAHGLDCDARGLGDYFYCRAPEPAEPIEPVQPALEAEVEPSEPSLPPEVEALQQYQADLEEARMVAVWNPTPDNLRRYQELQLVTMEKSEAFADAYMVNSWQVPGLAYDSTVPVNALGASAYKSSLRAAQKAHLGAVSQQYGLMYFYASNCGACRVFSPVLREFAQLYGFDVMAIAMDGQPSATFPDWRPDNGIAREVGLDGGVTPAVLLFDAATSRTIPLGFGVMGRDDLELRVFELTGGTLDGFTSQLGPDR